MKQLLWTIQTEEAYQEFVKTGILRANEDHLFCGDDLRFAYDWLSKQMVSRIGSPPENVRYPVWAWYQWEGKRKRMDQRLSGYAKRGTPLVQITFEADPDSFLLSDFDMWHIVLANPGVKCLAVKGIRNLRDFKVPEEERMVAIAKLQKENDERRILIAQEREWREKLNSFKRLNTYYSTQRPVLQPPKPTISFEEKIRLGKLEVAAKMAGSF